MRYLILTAALLLTASDALASCRCGGGGSGRRGGPVVRLVRAHETHAAARGCQPTSTAFPTASPPPAPATVSGCASGRCPVPSR